MKQVEIKITGREKLMQNIAKLRIVITADANKGLENSSKVLRDSAIDILNLSVGTGKWPSLGVSTDPIRVKEKWTIQKLSPLEVKLTSTSGHSAIVELGAIGEVRASDYGHKAWPIGRQQGGVVAYRPTFTLQSGYHYLTRAMNSPTVRKSMLNEIAKVLRQSLSKVVI